MIIDTHQHYWAYNAQDHGWITDDMAALQRDFHPEDMLLPMENNDVVVAIAVQTLQNEWETQRLLEYAKEHPWIAGIIGWLDLMDPNLGKRLEHYCKDPNFKGVRHILQAEDKGFMAQAKFLKGISKLAAQDLVYEIVVGSHQLDEVITMVKRFPEQKFVLDHMGKPCIGDRVNPEWKRQIHELGLMHNVYCKVSGMVTEAKKGWTKIDFFPYLDVVRAAFGSKKLFYGSNWPVCLLAATYEQQLGIVSDYFSSDKEVAKNFFFLNAFKFYDLKNEGLISDW